MSESRVGATCLVVLGVGIALLLPLFMAVFPALGITRDTAGHPEIVLPILADHPALPKGVGLVQVIAHLAGAVGMLGLWLRWGPRSLLLVAATFAGLVWMALDIANNGVALREVPRLAAAHVAGDGSAAAAFKNLSALIDALRLAAHFCGGVWVLGVSAFARRAGCLPRWLVLAGFVVGAIFSANLLVPPLMFLSMLTVPPWLIATGVLVNRRTAAS